MPDPGLLSALFATLSGLGAAVLARRLSPAWRLHLRLRRGTATTHGRALPAPAPRLGYGPATAVAPLAALSLIRPWGPLPDGAGVLLALLAASLAALGAGQAVVWWRRRRMRELYPDWLAFLSVALDFGIPLAAAAEVAAAGLEPPLRRAAERLAAGLAGDAPRRALDRFAAAVGTPEARFVASLLERQRHLGVSVASTLLEEEGLLTRLRWQERRGRQGVVPYAFTAAVGVLLVNAAVLFLVPRAAALIGTFRVAGP